MRNFIEYVIAAVVVGVAATAFMDVISAARKRIFGTPTLDYALVGRWTAYLSHGRFRHNPISASAPFAGERTIGWIVHYVSGVIFACILLAVWGVGWTCSPTLGPALVVGIGSIVAPFLIMQPGMGAGIAARRTPKPNQARLRSLITHTIFAVGLYLGGLLMSEIAVYQCAAVAA